MQDFEREKINEWAVQLEFEKIVHYVNLLKEPSYEHLGKKVSALNNLQRYSEAIDVLETIRIAGEQDPSWYYRYGFSLFYLDRYEESKLYFEKSYLLYPIENDSVWFLNYMRSNNLVESSFDERMSLDDLTPFLSRQKYDGSYAFMENSDVIIGVLLDEIRVSLQLMVHALETIADSNVDVLYIWLGFVQEFFKLLVKYDVAIDEDVIGELSMYNFHIFRQFGVSFPIIELSNQLVFWELATCDDQARVKPRDIVKIMFYSKIENHQKIIDLIESLSKDEFTFSYMEWLTQAYVFNGQPNMAIKTLKRQMPNSPDEKAFWYYLYGWILFRLEEYDHARDYFLASLSYDDSDESVWELLELSAELTEDTDMLMWCYEQREKRKQHGDETIDSYE